MKINFALSPVEERVLNIIFIDLEMSLGKVPYRNTKSHYDFTSFPMTLMHILTC